MKVLNLPNTLTIMRIVTIPVFTTAVIYKRYDYALYLFIFAALTDTLDGLFARLTDQKTAFGTFLDPLADKFLLVTAFIVFAVSGLIPLWLTITIVSRDVIVVMGWIVIYLVAGKSTINTTKTGKLAIAMQLLLLCYVLLDINVPSVPDIHGMLIWITAITTIASGLHYIYRGFKTTYAE